MVATPERRRHARYPFERHLEVRVPAGRIVVRANDISQGGFSFVSQQPLVVGEHIVLGLRHDDDFLVEAEVKNVRADGEHFIIGAERLGS
jgi:hypothetical protein